jgi:hypothetical protein
MDSRIYQYWQYRFKDNQHFRVSATTAWVGAFNNTSGIGGVWKTSDGGATWINQKMLSTVDESWTNYVHFLMQTTVLLLVVIRKVADSKSIQHLTAALHGQEFLQPIFPTH